MLCNNLLKPEVRFFLRILFCLYAFLPMRAVHAEEPPLRPDTPERVEIPSRPEMPQPPITDRSNEPESINNQYERIGESHIILNLENHFRQYWTEVEWVDSNGDWHVVEGWRGYTSNGWIRWFVAEPELGRGPFRWQVYDQENGVLLASGKPFYLPAYENTVVEVNVNLAIPFRPIQSE